MNWRCPKGNNPLPHSKWLTWIKEMAASDKHRTPDARAEVADLLPHGMSHRRRISIGFLLPSENHIYTLTVGIET